MAGTAPFKFYNYLTTHPDFLSTVVNAWSVTETSSHSLASLVRKQKLLRVALKTLNKDNFSEIQKRVSEVTQQYHHAQLVSLHDLSQANFHAERLISEKLSMLRRIE